MSKKTSGPETVAEAVEARAAREGPKRPKHLRRGERARLVAALGERGSPLAATAAAAHKNVCILEDKLNAERTALMAMLRLAKLL